ncbi:MAG: hypothetical protein HQM10_05825 [Candidatus Riflebacteria bacterium]|nr:hypothetical protein [Candidatus Riflebacteria bacterium]
MLTLNKCSRTLLAGILVLVFVASQTIAWGATREELMDKFWKLDQTSQSIMKEISALADRYKTVKVFSVSGDEIFHNLLKKGYKVAIMVRDLKKETLGEANTAEMHDQFAQICEKKQLTDDQLFRVLISTLSHLVIYEYVSFHYHLATMDETLIKRMNETNVYGSTGHFDRIQKAWLSINARQQFAKALELIHNSSAQLDRMQTNGAFYLSALRKRLDTYLVDELRKSSGSWNCLGDYVLAAKDLLANRNRKHLNWMEYQLSRVFGNAVGAINIQKFMSNIPAEEMQRLKDKVLKPGDVILEKTSGAITDKFIRGHFGHVAVYFGRPDQLKGITLSNGTPLLETDVVKRYLKRIEDGETTVEAIRPGTNLADISEWTVTDLAILRPTSYPKDKIGDALYRLINYVGTVYDFAFDVNTASIVVCSETPYQVFKGINFRTARSAGRYTISPDDVAVLAGPESSTSNRPFQLIYFNHETKPVPRNEMMGLYIKLLEIEKSRYNDVPKNNHDYSSLK